MDAFQQLLDAARLLMALSELRKGKNAKEHLRNLTPQVKHQRVLDLLRRMGVQVEDTPRGPQRIGGVRNFQVEGDQLKVRGEAPDFRRPFGRIGWQDTPTGHREPIYGDPGGPDEFHPPSFPHAHEVGHAMMTPVGRTAESYQQELDARRGEYDQQPYPPSVVNWAGGEEEAANLIENGLWRRAGAGKPETRITHNQWLINGKGYKRHSELAAQKRSHAKDRPVAEKLARPVQRDWDLGLRRFHDGQVERSNTTDARINARSLGQSPPNRRPDPSPAPKLPEPK